ncbi:bifunctional proline dehydrogenase/L-glutamate gamma-semialdehyde dehydrogenase PutA [Legionella impletisoli]|uniref:Bifunctional protein PutA n=1 Tax=Legionella impletisoli TaxID=343510 RepID=A0A917JP00_9GAMM|nr:bifunctional proline dehydrogenase/L-glutamate gamma-semialdehyde dehydrogenase PutA [Legionella impletisoli]GGI75804.1 bifunctional protein PutA [Legionella impletisoli]
MLDKQSLHQPKGLRRTINDAYREDEYSIVSKLIERAELNDETQSFVKREATKLVEQVRSERKKSTGIDSFLSEYALSSDEGIALMCLAEALLRVPDNATIDDLIKDKLASANWKAHRGQSESFFVNATTWALMLTGKVLSPEKADSVLTKALMKLINRSSEAVVRKAVDKAMRIMSKQFVMGQTIQDALTRAKKKEAIGYRYSYDMLGEAALTSADAKRYLDAYANAIEAIGKETKGEGTVYSNPGISIKLSALHPKYHEAQYDRVLQELPPRLLSLAKCAKQYNIALTVDAEESERLDISLDVIERVVKDPALAGWDGFGMAVQSYQKRAFYLLDWVAQLARENKRRIMVRLIKGAYWDSEIKKTQMQGLEEYPVFTRKAFTDTSFQACAKKLLTMTDAIYPQFATHNAYSVALILGLAGNYRDFEFQCLHGMGNELYDQVVPSNRLAIPCRIYAPVGTHEDLLPYLVRRLLENGANSSFVNRIVDDKAPISKLVEDPVAKSKALLSKMNQNIPLPKDIFLPLRSNSIGIDFTNREERARLQQDLNHWSEQKWQATPLIKDKSFKAELGQSCFSPQAPDRFVGNVLEATEEDTDWALTQAVESFAAWSTMPVSLRAAMIRQYAKLLQDNMTRFLAIASLEAGKTLYDGVAEVREAIDFCHYYATKAEQLMTSPIELHGYTGERNELSLHPRGVVLCISPWNFPLAIFTGQVVAALVTGNCVIAKPAEQTPLIASLAVELMHKAGIPKGVIQLLPGKGETIGAKLVQDKRIKGVIFTGSTQTAALINKTLATRGGELIPLIAETGGQNAMIVDSSALLEQVVMDVITSAFGSAGQRCSALRVLYVQDEVYPRFKELLKGAMAELEIGDPVLLKTDVGPVIDQEALDNLKSHVDKMVQTYKTIYQCSASTKGNGYYLPPIAFEIDNINALEKEVFGPVLHVIRFKRKNLDDVIHQINSTGYGLTLGIHSRINQTVEYIRDRVHVGNCYVNRNMIGAVVGLQPFGGEGLSGTGPKAGGPFYLPRLCHERTYTVDTTAAGGNATLMSIPED